MAEATDTRRFAMAKRLKAAGREDGVDLTFGEAIQAWSDRFNTSPVDDAWHSVACHVRNAASLSPPSSAAAANWSRLTPPVTTPVLRTGQSRTTQWGRTLHLYKNIN